MRESKEPVILPPYSRVFVMHGPNVTKDDLGEAFEGFGTIEDIFMVQQRDSRDLKGISYIKYSKMSEAALAAEQMNGESLACNPTRPIKVVIANSREEGARRDDDSTDRFSRLFIVIPKDDSEDEESLRKYFQMFGDVEFVNIIRHFKTHENKGFAYVKFFKMYHAAKALEECDPKYKAVLAKPKKNRDHKYLNNHHNDHHDNYHKPPKDYQQPSTAPHYGDLFEGHSSDKGYTRISAYISTELCEDLAIRLFDLIPGLAYARLSEEVISHRTQKMDLAYETPEAAAFAVDRLNDFEYPPGEPIMLKPEPDEGSTSHSSRSFSKSSQPERKRDHQGYQARSSGSSAKYCSVRLPPVLPPVTNKEGKYRLLVVCDPEIPPVSVLRDVFCRFGKFVDAQVAPGKNYGYVYYTDEESAMKAMQVLHDEELQGNRMKITPAASSEEKKSKKARYE